MNFLSSGNIFTEIDLNTSGTTLICGTNGSGKSTLIDAISFGLFNKAFRKVTKPQLLNSINAKGLLVEIEFSHNSREYKIRRGMKPNIFEIYQDGTLINQSADSKDYQSILEKNILKINHRTFCQIVVLGPANFTPFMQLNPAQRREVIEDLLDIQIFSVMNTLLKDKSSSNKSDLLELDTQVKLTEQAISITRAHQEEMKKNHDGMISEKEVKISKYSNQNEIISEEIQKLEKERTTLDERYRELHNPSTTKMEKALAAKKKLDAIVKRADKEISFYTNTDVCHTCEQSISQDFKTVRITSREQELAKSSVQIEQLNSSICKIQAVLDEAIEIMKAAVHIGNDISRLNGDIASNNRLIKALQKEISDLQKKQSTNASTDADEAKLQSLQAQREALIQTRELYNVAMMLLKDDGIKTQIVKQYIPIINKNINRYLDQMEFFCQFQINENFEEVIKSRFRDEFSYESFSEGEKTRIDLALLFTWREIARMRNSASTNLLILDEFMDSSLDQTGTDEFVNIVQSLAGGNNIIIISHKTDQIGDKFDRKIVFHKDKNFSRIKE